MTNNNGVYIPSIDAKDIYLSAHYIEENPEGNNLKLNDGQYNLRKFIILFSQKNLKLLAESIDFCFSNFL